MADLAQLQEAILRNRQATQGLAGLDEQYARANALRDQQRPSMDQYGQVSPLSVIANTIDRSRGRRDARELAPQRTSARDDIAAGEAAVQNNALALTMAKEGRDITKAAEDTGTYEDSLLTAEQKRALDARKADENRGEGETWTDGKAKIAIAYDKDNKPYDVANPQRDLTGFYPDAKSGSGSGYVTSMKGGTLDALHDESNMLRKFNDSVSSFEDRFVQVGGVKTSVLNNLIEKASGEDLLMYAQQEGLTKDARDAAQWWANFKMEYELPGRNKIFGATLTDRENASWKEAVLAMRSMAPEELRKRLGKLQTNLGEDFTSRVGILKRAYADNPGDMAALDYAAKRSGLVQNPETGDWEGAGVTTPTRDPLDAINQVENSKSDQPPVELTPELIDIRDRLPSLDRTIFDAMPAHLQEKYLKSKLGSPSLLPKAVRKYGRFAGGN